MILFSLTPFARIWKLPDRPNEGEFPRVDAVPVRD